MLSVIQRKTRGLQLRAVALCVLLLSPVTVSAADFSVSARQVKSASISSSGATVDYSLQSRFSANDPRYKTAKASYTPTRILNMAKRNNPASRVANTLLIAAAASAGYVIDELTDQVLKPATGEGFEDDGTWISGYYVEIAYDTVRLENYGPTHSHCAGNGGELHPNGTGGYTCYLPNPTSPGNYKHYAMPRYACPTSPQKVDGFWYSEWLPYSMCGTAPINSEPLTEDELGDFIKEALSSMSSEELREFFNNTYGLPELTPELQALLDDWMQGIASETGLTGETLETDYSTSPLDQQNVTAELKDDAMPSGVSELALDQYQGTEFQDREGDINEILTGVTQAPSLIWNPNLPDAQTCQSFPLEWNGTTIQVPGVEACANFDIFKDMLGYLLYLITAFMMFEIFFKPKSV